METWQKCPVCNGSGKIHMFDYSKSAPESAEICETCNGTGLISILTGHPPNTALYSTGSYTPDEGATIHRCIGFKLLIEYPGCEKKVGDFVPFATVEFLDYPKIWEPVYKKEDWVVETDRY